MDDGTFIIAAGLLVAMVIAAVFFAVVYHCPCFDRRGDPGEGLPLVEPTAN